MLNPIEQMVEQQIRAWEVLDPAVLDAMQNVSREHFLPKKYKKLAHTDVSFELRNDFTLPCPSVQGKILQALQVTQKDAIYQIGAGIGYLSACLAFLGGHVTLTESDAEVLNTCSENFSSLDITNFNTVHQSWTEALELTENKYDVIVSQYAFTEVPDSLKKGLKLNGRAVLFTGTGFINECIAIERIGKNEWLESRIFETQLSKFPVKSIAKFSF